MTTSTASIQAAGFIVETDAFIVSAASTREEAIAKAIATGLPAEEIDDVEVRVEPASQALIDQVNNEGTPACWAQKDGISVTWEGN